MPCILHTIHGPSFGAFQGWARNFAFRTAEKIAARCTTHFISVAEAMTRQYLAAGVGRPGQFSCIYSGFDLQPFLTTKNDPAVRAKWGLAPNDFVVGKVARFFKLKGHEELLAAAPMLVKRCPQIKFLLVGDGVLRPGFEAQVRELGLDRHFVFTGLVTPPEIPELIGIMDVLVHLSQREGLARALPQALAAERPIVAYDCDGANEICLSEKTGFLIQPGNKTELVSALSALAANPDLRTRLGRQGRELVRERFGIEKMVDSLYALYRKLLEQNAGNLR